MEAPRYEEVRKAFARLRLEEKARFLIEATAATLADGIEAAGTLLARGLERCLEVCQQKTRPEPSGTGTTAES
ncbi:MAG: hypothetical protein Q9M35_00970 [Rhodothermus sp.]|nr:hypothetical protein [Rhodothermus sp.]